MKQLVIYVAVMALLSSCANQGNLAHFEDDGIYARPANSKSSSAGTADAYYFVDEGNNGAEQRSGEYYGNSDDELATTDDYVPEARSLPSESGSAYNNHRYNSPTYSAGYASAMPLTMRMGYSSFHNPYGFGGGMAIGMGYGYMDPWWGFYDPWHPWYRWNRWNSWHAWHMWTPYGPYGMCYGGWGWGYGYGMGMNSYNSGNYWAGESNNNNYHGPRPGFGGGSFGSAGGSGAGSFDGLSRSGTQPANRPASFSRTDGATRSDRPSGIDGADRSRNPNQLPSRDATRTPSAQPDQSRQNSDRSFFRWNTPRNNSPGTSRPNSGYTPPSRGGTPPATRPGGSSRPSNNYSRPSAPSRSPSMSPSSPSRSSGGGGGGGSRGGFRR